MSTLSADVGTGKRSTSNGPIWLGIRANFDRPGISSTRSTPNPSPAQRVTNPIADRTATAPADPIAASAQRTNPPDLERRNPTTRCTPEASNSSSKAECLMAQANPTAAETASHRCQEGFSIYRAMKINERNAAAVNGMSLPAIDECAMHSGTIDTIAAEINPATGPRTRAAAQ